MRVKTGKAVNGTNVTTDNTTPKEEIAEPSPNESPGIPEKSEESVDIRPP